MATRIKSRSTRTSNAGASRAARLPQPQPRLTGASVGSLSPALPEGVNVFDVRRTIERAIDSLFRIWRLADRTRDELDENNVDGRIFVDHAAELCFLRGKELDELYRLLSGGGIVVGTFRGFDLADYETPIGSRPVANREVHHG